MNIDNLIREKLNIENDLNFKIYDNLENRSQFHKSIAEIVNSYIPQIETCHDLEHEKNLKSNGFTIIENFFTEEEVDFVLNLIKDAPGYNYHIAANSYNQESRTLENMGDWNILSYKPDVFLKSSEMMQKFINKKFVSLAQSYFGCFPTFYSINCMASQFTGVEFKTQHIHRDYDDFKFLSFFVYLKDIDTNNGPHMYFAGTQNGETSDLEPVEIIGKRGTGVVADTYGLHYGKPLNEKDRILLWFRFGLSLNKIHYKNQDHLFAQDEDLLMTEIENTIHNKYLLRGFIKNVSI